MPKNMNLVSVTLWWVMGERSDKDREYIVARKVEKREGVDAVKSEGQGH
jgi:hypothetical protein